MKPRLLIGIGIGCLVSALLGAVVLVGGVGLLIYSYALPSEDVLIEVDAPIRIKEGDPVSLIVTIENTSDEMQVLDSIDISNGYLDGFVMDDIQPGVLDSYDIWLLDMRNYTFLQEINPGKTLIVEYRGTAVKSGDFSGDIDVCINSIEECRRMPLRSVVDE